MTTDARSAGSADEIDADTETDAAGDTDTDTAIALDTESGVDNDPAVDDHLEQARLRAHIAAVTIELIRTGETLRPDSAAVSEAAGVDQEVVQRQFPTWESLVAVAVMRWHEGRIAPLLATAGGGGAVVFLERLIAANLADPRMMRLLVSTLTAGADAANPAAPFYRNQYAGFHRTVRGLFEQDVLAGREPATIDPRRAADQLLALYEGLQLQGMLRDGLDVLAAFRDVTGRLRRGWAAGVGGEAADGVYDI